MPKAMKKAAPKAAAKKAMKAAPAKKEKKAAAKSRSASPEKPVEKPVAKGKKGKKAATPAQSPQREASPSPVKASPTKISVSAARQKRLKKLAGLLKRPELPIDGPSSNRAMLSDVSINAFAQKSAERGGIAMQFATIVTAQLRAAKQNLSVEVNRINQDAAVAMTDVSKYEMAKNTAGDAVDAAGQYTGSAKESLKEAKATEASAKDAVKKAESEQKEQDLALENVDKDVVAAQKARDESFAALCAEDDELNAKDRKKHIGLIVPVMKRMSVDGSLLQACPAALGKTAAERGAFDKATIDAIGAHFQQYIDMASARRASAESALSAAVAKVSSASAQLESAESARKRASAELEAADSQESAAKKALDEAKTALKTSEKSLQKAQDAVGAAEANVNICSEALAEIAFLDGEAVDEDMQ